MDGMDEMDLMDLMDGMDRMDLMDLMDGMDGMDGMDSEPRSAAAAVCDWREPIAGASGGSHVTRLALAALGGA